MSIFDSISNSFGNSKFKPLGHKDILELRQKRQAAVAVQRGKVTFGKLGKSNTIFNVPLTFLIMLIALMVIATKHWIWLNHVVDPHYAHDKLLFAFEPFITLTKRSYVILRRSLLYGFTWSVIISVFYLMLPVFSFFLKMLLSRKIPTRSSLKNYTAMHRILSVFTLSAVIVFLLGNPYSIRHKIYKWGFDAAHWHLAGLVLFLIVTVVVFCAIGFLILWKIPKNQTVIKPSLLTRLKKIVQKPTFSLYFGKSTGKLIKRKHKSGIASNQNICLSLRDAILNVLILGGLGVGKTTSIINPLLLQLMDDGYGGLIFDIKGSFKNVVEKFAQELDRDISYIGTGHAPINIIDGLSPETAAEYIRAAIMLDNAEGRGDPHWLEAANQLATSVLGLLHFFPQHYSLEYMHIFLYDNDFREKQQFPSNKKVML